MTNQREAVSNANIFPIMLLILRFFAIPSRHYQVHDKRLAVGDTFFVVTIRTLPTRSSYPKPGPVNPVGGDFCVQGVTQAKEARNFFWLANTKP